ncbi:hypothetical protein R1sor_024942 [Riccia sorocarpa]|uniref:C2 domain-containing protein n=1 Tax=Riccia sorocarpa TaxID=122646 RepID=A0ABD3GB17_9MARC
MFPCSERVNCDACSVWKKLYVVEVEDLESEKLLLKVFEEDSSQEEELLGCAEVSLKELQACFPEEKCLNLVSLELLYHPYDRNFAAMWHREATTEVAESSVGRANRVSNLDKQTGIPDEANLNFIESLRLHHGPSLNHDHPHKGQMSEAVRGVLSVTVVRAENLGVADKNGLSDPFVVLKMRNSKTKKQTKVVYKTLNPVWNQTLHFPVEDAIHDMLDIKVLDHDTFRNDFLGNYSMPLTKTIYTGEYDAEFKLDGVTTGKLFLHMKWTPESSGVSNAKSQRRHIIF